MSFALTAQQILGMSLEDVHQLQDTVFSVAYDDGVTVPTRQKEIIFNRHCWRPFFCYPNTPIVSTCTATHVIGNGNFNGDTHKLLLEQTFRHICKHNGLEAYYMKEPLLLAVQMACNDILNSIVHRVSGHVATIDATDYVKLIKDPEIADIHINLKPTPESIDKAYKSIKAYINNTPTSNQFAAAYRSKAINDNQANQCIGPRGFVTDLDRTVFRQPILNGFIRGMATLYELMTESRTAAKSLNANESHISTSEYASRRIQLLSMVITNAIAGDCGSTEYIDFFVTPARFENMRGKYYFDEADQKLKFIKGDETHLINSVVKLRTIFGCKLDNPQHVCSTCLGRISLNFKENTNVGYAMVAFLMEMMSQAILSTKHLTHSVKKALIKLTGDVNKYFYTDEENDIYFNPGTNLKGVSLILPNNRVSKLIDVLNLRHTNISMTKIGELETIGYKDSKGKAGFIEQLNISYKDRNSILTPEFLRYIKTISTSWLAAEGNNTAGNHKNPNIPKIESDARGNFVIPMDGFDITQPVFNNPLKETNIISFVNRVASMIETNKDKITDPVNKLTNIFDAVIDQFKCNISVIETIVYATTSYNAFNGDYRLSRNSTHARCENRGVLFRHRSASQLLVFEEQMKELIPQAPVFFSNKKRMGYPMDVLFVPDKLVS